MTRFRILPTKGTKGGLFVHGSPLEALVLAQEMSDERGCPVLLAEHPEDGCIRQITTVGEKKKGQR